jgi:hypothetical protein
MVATLIFCHSDEATPTNSMQKCMILTVPTVCTKQGFIILTEEFLTFQGKTVANYGIIGLTIYSSRL